MLKCMLYRQTHEYTNIGSDDGLQIYRGTWSHRVDGALVTYHLADAEITFTGYEAARKRQIQATAKLSANSLRMPVFEFHLQPNRFVATTFQPKASLPAPLRKRFIDCDEPPNRPNQTVERTSTRLVSARKIATMSFMLSSLAPGRRRSPCSR
jgi:hypothetical protein